MRVSRLCGAITAEWVSAVSFVKKYWASRLFSVCSSEPTFVDPFVST
jgi:hypothetical protein